jgi:hypothetical protein
VPPSVVATVMVLQGERRLAVAAFHDRAGRVQHRAAHARVDPHDPHRPVGQVVDEGVRRAPSGSSTAVRLPLMSSLIGKCFGGGELAEPYVLRLWARGEREVECDGCSGAV